jgi:predicted RNA-binding Zn ribbon-like protein
MAMEESIAQDRTTTALKRQTDTRPAMDYMFLSGVLALDLVNTEVVVRGKRGDLFATPEEVANWWSQALTHHPDGEKIKADMDTIVWSDQLLERIKRLRAAIRTLCTNLVEQQSVDREALTTLNTILALGYPALEAAPGPEMVPIYRTRADDQGAVLLPIALSAFHLFTRVEKHRLHICKNERCILFFYDTTKSATRQWCSLECMNRARSLQHYRHLKEERVFTSSEDPVLP